MKSALKYPHSPKKNCFVTWRPKSPGNTSNKNTRIAHKTKLSWYVSDEKIRKVSGVLQASMETSTSDVQLDLINHNGSRLLSMFVDLPRHFIFKVKGPGVHLDVGEGEDVFDIDWKEMGSVWWCEDESMRRPDAHGFNIEWLKFCHQNKCTIRD